MNEHDNENGPSGIAVPKCNAATPLIVGGKPVGKVCKLMTLV